MIARDACRIVKVRIKKKYLPLEKDMCISVRSYQVGLNWQEIWHFFMPLVKMTFFDRKKNIIRSTFRKYHVKKNDMKFRIFYVVRKNDIFWP